MTKPTQAGCFISPTKRNKLDQNKENTVPTKMTADDIFSAIKQKGSLAGFTQLKLETILAEFRNADLIHGFKKSPDHTNKPLASYEIINHDFSILNLELNLANGTISRLKEKITEKTQPNTSSEGDEFDSLLEENDSGKLQLSRRNAEQFSSNLRATSSENIESGLVSITQADKFTLDAMLHDLSNSCADTAHANKTITLLKKLADEKGPNLFLKLLTNEISQQVKLKTPLAKQHKLSELAALIKESFNKSLASTLSAEVNNALILCKKNDFTAVKASIAKLSQLATEFRDKLVAALKGSNDGKHKRVEIIPDRDYGIVSVPQGKEQQEFSNEDRLAEHLAHDQLNLANKYMSIQTKGTNLSATQRRFSLSRSEVKYKIFEEYIEGITQISDQGLKERICLKLLAEFTNLLAVMLLYNVSNNDMHGANLKIAFKTEKYRDSNGKLSELNVIDRVVAFDWGHLQLGSNVQPSQDLAYHFNYASDARSLYTKTRRWQNSAKPNALMHNTPIAHIISLLTKNHQEAMTLYNKINFTENYKQIVNTHTRNEKLPLIAEYQAIFTTITNFLYSNNLIPKELIKETLKTSSLDEELNHISTISVNLNKELTVDETCSHSFKADAKSIKAICQQLNLLPIKQNSDAKELVIQLNQLCLSNKALFIKLIAAIGLNLLPPVLARGKDGILAILKKLQLTKSELIFFSDHINISEEKMLQIIDKLYLQKTETDENLFQFTSLIAPKILKRGKEGYQIEINSLNEVKSFA